jgi:hypothetical protein
MDEERRFAVATHALRGYKSGYGETIRARTLAARMCLKLQAKTGAAKRIRTPDPRITNALLYQLSYCGVATRKGPHSNLWGLPTKDYRRP